MFLDGKITLFALSKWTNTQSLSLSVNQFFSYEFVKEVKRTSA